MKFSFRKPSFKLSDIFNLWRVKNSKAADSSPTYIRTGTTVSRADGKPLTDDDVERLIAFGKAQAFQEEWTSSRTKREEELEDDFFIKYYEQFQPIEHEMIETIQQAKTFKGNIDEKIELCNKAINLFYDLKKFCSRSKGGKLYFADTWEHCHNSRSEDFSFTEETEKLLVDLQLNYDDYDAYFKGLKTLKKDLLKFISDNPLFLQREIYKHFHPRMKYDIQICLRECEKEGLIKREKKVNSYTLQTLNKSEKGAKS